ncbi:Hydroxyethylthiazole kinase [Pelotomaculum schinkii]|uniref:Hydroxyethylthiazole kinase n=1 Tax=Pelotomaculum schinkii TaxID=78350 RepID=A0A4Y7R8X7_9FIRM|nr:hydroxyethylthiazole kinase [Pelotomaculum schinkii]TEB05236.1 Hydroxyethylthiazole kinase [Pelotomaculum schinkii]
MLNKIASALNTVRDKTPLVQAITNYVTINDCANILLCFGASPAMCEVRSEVEEFAGFISALYINLGTLTEEQKVAAVLAAKKATELQKPVVLDPVACPVITRKMDVSRELLENAKITVVKGNIAEIKSLAGFKSMARGVDSLDEGDDAVEACVSLAKKYGTVVVATGKTDIITDGERTCLIHNGTPMLRMVIGTGCMVGALVAAAAGTVEDKWVASAAAVMIMGLAGEMTAGSMVKELPGTFRVRLFDYVYGMTAQDILKGGRIECL